jgi:hypothetical protein
MTLPHDDSRAPSPSSPRPENLTPAEDASRAQAMPPTGSATDPDVAVTLAPSTGPAVGPSSETATLPPVAPSPAIQNLLLRWQKMRQQGKSLAAEDCATLQPRNRSTWPKGDRPSGHAKAVMLEKLAVC